MCERELRATRLKTVDSYAVQRRPQGQAGGKGLLQTMHTPALETTHLTLTPARPPKHPHLEAGRHHPRHLVLVQPPAGARGEVVEEGGVVQRVLAAQGVVDLDLLPGVIGEGVGRVGEVSGVEEGPAGSCSPGSGRS